jgi:broad specificity phosphatase PhoE
LRLALLRHGPTEWNEEGRLQGQLDIPLSEAGRIKMAALLPPHGFEAVRAFTSPLSRARETARLMGFPEAAPDARLMEHNWGDWQGSTREEILARDGADAFVKAGSGIDFTPKGGESTRAFLARIGDFLADVAKEERDAIAFSHRGVLRTAYALATGWDMATPMPAKLDLSKALILDVDADGSSRIAEMNLELPKR